jgi:hypothetical protein
LLRNLRFRDVAAREVSAAAGLSAGNICLPSRKTAL